jgi:nucleotide-binding universal stress UspA family protein
MVLGSSPRGALRDELRGSVETQVAAHAHCPVALVPLPSVPPSDRDAGMADAPVVVGYDGSPPAALALQYAADAAWHGGRPLRVVVAWRPGPSEWLESFAGGNLPRDATEAEAQHTLAEGLKRVRDHNAAAGRRSDEPDGVIAEGRAIDVLYREAVTAERLVIGTRGRGGFAALLLGSVTHTLMRAAPCPVIAVRADEG